MELGDFLYNNRNDLGIKDNASYGDIVKLEESIRKWYGDNEPDKVENSDEDIVKLVDLSILMKILLEECRMNKLPLTLSKRIDELLKEIDYL